ncbi:MAG: hypothetical protein HN368_01895, partial [Spirochaetales bacterium]|nr:hypothetical protein [Spirochaetales bacterium]
MKSGREEGLKQIRNHLIGLYGNDQGEKNFNYLSHSLRDFLSGDRDSQSVPSDQFSRLAGKVFAICYPDNVVDEGEPTLSTLGTVLQKYFPAINGIHILPEREMSHDDLLSQDLLPFTGADSARILITRLKDEGILDAAGRVVNGYEDRCGFLAEEFPDSSKQVMGLLSSRFNSHFNDGGFSQVSREHVDPRFGTVDDIRNLSNTFELMLDYVVNHLDIDNKVLDAYRKGDNDGSAFLIISPARYKELKRSGEIEKTFRPRPFPLFTGLRKYPETTTDDAEPAELFNTLFEEEGLPPLDPRLIDFLSIFFKVRNDQGLTALDKRTFDDFQRYAAETTADISAILIPSDLHDRQMKAVSTDLELTDVCTLLELPDLYAAIFADNEDAVYGEKFFIYTTFSESQADINPVSPAGFRLIIDDLFHLLSAGDLAMMRMDAIKYLWKEIGKKNFDMEEGNRLIEVIRILLELALPEMIPLDEINSPDAVVYDMAKDGGFAYLFGQVNSVPAAFNSGTLGPIERFYSMMKQRCPENLVLFVMLSTHDG